MSRRVSPELVASIGKIIAVTYPFFSLATGARAIYQLIFPPNAADLRGPILTGVASLIYLIAALLFVYRKPWTWWLAVILLTFESLGVLTVGTISLIHPNFIGQTAWQDYGMDYFFIPLIQPFLGLIWLLWPGNRLLYQNQSLAQPGRHIG
jgi:hypothetical protein